MTTMLRNGRNAAYAFFLFAMTNALVPAPAAALDTRTIDAIATAKAALFGDLCQGLIEGPLPAFGENANTVIFGIQSANRYIEDPNTNLVQEGRVVAALTRFVGSGSNATTTLFKGFFDGVYTPSEFLPPPAIPLNPVEVRAAIILHELAHATGALPNDRSPNVEQFNSDIVTFCLRPEQPPLEPIAELCPFGEDPHPVGGIIPRTPCDPILLDFGRIGFDLTSGDDGVAFDLDADGRPHLIAWTARGSLDAFLVLDRNGNGVVDDGSELFGNATTLLDGTRARNGYEVLAEFDQEIGGGNANGFIEREDSIYEDLRLWTDANHDGHSQPNELTSLADRAVVALRTRAVHSPVADRHGNRFALVSFAYVKGPRGIRPLLTSDVIFAFDR